ncbi:MAG TPA: hypothetical protein VJ761_05290 [Ktedonobacteraceae bacterium]|nr:hypothetical protein [Ktedonobacteraceae bacterium]
MPFTINPITLVALVALIASTLSGILRQNRLPERQYINAGITALFMLLAALASLFVAGHALTWSAILAEVGVIMVGPGAALESFLQVKVNTGIPFIDNEVASLESQLPGGTKSTNAYVPSQVPQPIVFPPQSSTTNNTPDHAG